MAARQLRGPLAIAGAMLGAGFFVAEYAMAHPIGENIPVERQVARDQGAQGEAVKAGAKSEEVAGKLTVETKGGDKGLKMNEKYG